MNKSSHADATLKGLKWTSIDQVVSQITTFLIGILLMNLLAPEEFGIIAMATVFTGFLTVFSKSGLGASLVQSEQIDQIDIDTVFWASMAIGIVLSIIMAALSFPVSHLYNEPRLIEIIQILSLNFLIIPIGSTSASLLLKSMSFKKLFLVNSISIVGSAGLAIYLAFEGFGVWALVWHKLCESFLRVIGLNIFVRRIPNLNFSLNHLKKHLKFGIPYLGSKSLLYWVGNADNLIIGYYLGPFMLGLYSRAYAIVTVPSRKIGLVLSSVLFPSLAQLKNDKERLKQIFFKMNGALLFFIAPIMLIIALGSTPFILLIAGDEWLPSANMLKYLAFIAIVKVNIQILHNVLLSQGNSPLDFKLNLISGLIYVAVFFVCAQIGILTLVKVYLGASILVLLLWYKSLSDFLNISFSILITQFLKITFLISFIVLSWNLLKVTVGNLSIVNELSLLFGFVSIFWLAGNLIFNKRDTIDNFKNILRVVTV